MRRHGVAAGALAPLSPQAGPGSNQVRGGSHPAPRIPLRCVPLVCHPALTSGLPEARLESRSWPAPVSRHRNFRRSASGGTSPGLSPGGDTPVIVLTRACGRVAPVTRGSDVLACGFPGGARTRRSELPPPRSRDGSPGIRSAGRQPPRAEFHAFSLARRRVDPSVPRILWVLRLFSPAGDGTGRGFSYFILPDGTGSLDTGTRRSWLSFTTLLRTGREPPVLGGSRPGRNATWLWEPRRSEEVFYPTAVRRLALFTARAQRAFGPRVIRTRIRPLCGSGVHTELESRPGRRGRLQTAHPCSSGRTQACHAHLATAENRSPETGRTEQMAVWTLRPVSEGHLTGVGRPV